MVEQSVMQFLHLAALFDEVFLHVVVVPVVLCLAVLEVEAVVVQRFLEQECILKRQGDGKVEVCGTRHGSVVGGVEDGFVDRLERTVGLTVRQTPREAGLPVVARCDGVVEVLVVAAYGVEHLEAATVRRSYVHQSARLEAKKEGRPAA